MSLSRKISQAIDSIRFDTMSDEVKLSAKMHILDGLGVGLNGTLLKPLFDPVIELYSNREEKGQSTLYNRGNKVPARYAASINCLTTLSCPYQETHRASLGHPINVILTPALAIGEELNANGRQMVEAVVAGYESFVRVAASVNPSMLDRGIQTTGAIAPFGASVVAARMFGLNEEETRHAINHAANLAGSSLVEAHGAKPYFGYQAGVNVEKGIFAAELARAGVVGCDTIFEGGSTCDKGFLQAFSDDYDIDVLENGIPGRLGVEDVGFSFHYVASFSRTPIDALLWLVKEHDLTPAKIEKVRVNLTHVLHNFVNQKIESTAGRAAHYYIPLHMALTLVHGGVSDDTLTEESFTDPEIKAIMDRVEVGEDRQLDADYEKSKSVTSVIVEVDTADGQKFSKRLDAWRGDPENPASQAEIEEKFCRITSKILSQDRQQKLIEIVANLESLNNIREIGKLVCKET